MIALRLAVFMVGLWGSHSAIEHTLTVRNWWVIVNGFALPLNAWLTVSTWDEIVDWWKLQILMPTICAEANLFARNMRNNQPPLKEITLWKEP